MCSIGTKDGKATTIKGHQGAVRCVSFSQDGRFLMSTSDDKTAKVTSPRGGGGGGDLQRTA